MFNPVIEVKGEREVVFFRSQSTRTRSIPIIEIDLDGDSANCSTNRTLHYESAFNATKSECDQMRSDSSSSGRAYTISSPEFTKHHPNDHSLKLSNLCFNQASSKTNSSDQLNLSNLSLSFSPQSVTEKLRKVGFAEFNPMTSDAAAWLGSFEKRVTEFGCLDQALSIIIKYLDEFGLDFYRQTIRLVF